MSKSSSPTPLNIIIHPVGQGAFYSETFSNDDNHALFSAVYDCGGLMIKEQIETLKRLDLVFISHFHEDHIKGINLLKEKNPNALVVIPGISHRRFILDIIYNYAITGSIKCSAILFMLSVLDVLKAKKTEIYSQGIQGSIEMGLPISGATIVVPSGCHLMITLSSLWCYDASYNEYDESQEEELIQRLSSVFPYLRAALSGIATYHDLDWYKNEFLPRIQKLEPKRSSIKEIYAKVYDNSHNAYSMLVHSHPASDYYERYDCLYTGDATIETILNALKKINPHYIQVPHHGSDYNYDHRMYQEHPIAFISVGEKFPHGHPNQKTLVGLIQNCHYVHIITEDPYTKYKRSFAL